MTRTTLVLVATLAITGCAVVAANVAINVASVLAGQPEKLLGAGL